MTRAQGLSDFASGLGDTLKIDGNNNRVGINSTVPTEALDVVGNITATGTISGASFTGIDCYCRYRILVVMVLTANLNSTGVSGFATALSNDKLHL